MVKIPLLCYTRAARKEGEVNEKDIKDDAFKSNWKLSANDT